MDQRSPESPAEGDYVGKYRILGELGRGGMSVVYRAHDEVLGRQVALKSPLAADASDNDRHQFLREARSASRVSHPHVVPIFEVFEQDGRPWLAMGLVEGRTLRDTWSTDGRLPIEEVLLIGEQIADALAAAHYPITGKLGVRGTGSVYEAEDTECGRPVALKFLAEEIADDPDAVRRLVREAHLLALINHPNICAIYEVTKHDLRTFIVMKRIDGVTCAPGWR